MANQKKRAAEPPLKVEGKRSNVSRATRAYLRESSLQAYSAEASRTVNQPKFAGTSKLPPASAVCNAPALGCAASMTKANRPYSNSPIRRARMILEMKAIPALRDCRDTPFPMRPGRRRTTSKAGSRAAGRRVTGISSSSTAIAGCCTRRSPRPGTRRRAAGMRARGRCSISRRTRCASRRRPISWGIAVTPGSATTTTSVS